jgi:hypothetical protein
MLVAAIMLLTFLGISSAFADSIETTHIAMRKGETQKIRVTDLFIPEMNYKSGSDEMQMLRDEGLVVHPMTRADLTSCQLLGLSENDLLTKIKQRFGTGRCEEAALTAKLI